MKKIIGLLILASVLLTLGFVSAAPICATVDTTFVSGVITDANNGNVAVAGANVEVTCNGNKQYATSGVDGSYSVQFDAADCPNDETTTLVVSASKNGLTGSNNTADWYSESTQVGCLELIVNVACADVPLVPEFGTVVGIVTALGALGVFFIVRRK